jgi:DNA (cytosine-5)-methyltransferase 1
MGYQRAGFDVVGVDIHPQPHYPGTFVLADALTHPLDGFDAIHASPPCQAYTRKAATWGRARTTDRAHPDLLGPTRARLELQGTPYVIENVPGAPIRAQLLLCGTGFGLPLIKHRLFEASWALPMAPASCDHRAVYNPWSGKGRSAAQLRAAQGTPWIPMSGGASRLAGVTGDLFNAIPPAYTEWIGAAWILELR